MCPVLQQTLCPPSRAQRGGRGPAGGQERLPEAVALGRSQQVKEHSGREAGASERSEEVAASPTRLAGPEQKT